MNNYNEDKKIVKEILNKYNLKAFKIGNKYKITGNTGVLKTYFNISNLKDLINYIELNKINLEYLSNSLNADKKIWDFLDTIKNKVNIEISKTFNWFRINNTYIEIKNNNEDYSNYFIDIELFLYKKEIFSYTYVDYLIKNNQLNNENIEILFNLIELYKLNEKLTNKLVVKNIKTKKPKI